MYLLPKQRVFCYSQQRIEQYPTQALIIFLLGLRQVELRPQSGMPANTHLSI